jgi:GAF domain-containing protein
MTKPEAEAADVSEMILGLAKALSSTLDADAVFVRVLDSLGKVIPSDSSSIFLLKERKLELRACRGFGDPLRMAGLVLDLDHFLLDRFVVDNGTPIVLDDVREDPRWNADLPFRDSAGIRAWMGIPLVSSGEVIGTLCVDRREAAAFSPRELELARAFGDLASVAVRNARLFSETKRRLKELEAVNRVGRAVASHLDVRQLCEVVGANLVDIFRAGVVFVSVWDEPAGLVRALFHAIDGKRGEVPDLAYGRGLVSRVLERKATLYLETDAAARAAELGGIPDTDKAPLSWLGVPILSGDRAMGVLSVQSFERERAYSGEDIRLLATIADTAGAGIRNARLYEEARRKADEAAALAEAGREISESLEPEIVLERIAERPTATATRRERSSRARRTADRPRAHRGACRLPPLARHGRCPPGAGGSLPARRGRRRPLRERDQGGRHRAGHGHREPRPLDRLGPHSQRHPRGSRRGQDTRHLGGGRTRVGPSARRGAPPRRRLGQGRDGRLEDEGRIRIPGG